MLTFLSQSPLLKGTPPSGAPDWLLHLLSVDTERLGDGVRRLRFARFPEGEWGLLALLLAGLGVAFFFWNYRREGSLPGLPRLLLSTLRAAVLMGITVMLFYPVLEVDRARELRASTIILIDESLSQEIQDRYRGAPETKEALARSLGVASDEVPSKTRAELVALAFSRGQWRVLDRLAEQNELKTYFFSGGTPRAVSVEPPRPDTAAAPTGPGATGAVGAAPGAPDEEPGSGPLPPPRRLPPWSPRGPVTDIGSAVRAAVEAEGDGRIAGVVIVTDGRVTDGEDLKSLGAHLEDRNIPLHAVGVGDPTPTRNFRVVSLLASERVFTGDPVVVDVRVEQVGYPDDAARVELLDIYEPEGQPPQAPLRIGVEEARFIGGARESAVSFRFEPQGVGAHRLLARVEPREDETFSNDNERVARTEVVKEAARVLLLAGGPSFEYRFLKNLLRRDARIHVAAWLMSADPDYPQEGNVSLKKLPETMQELLEYDVVVLMDPDPRGLPAGFTEKLELFVGKHRGGLVFSAGEKFAADFFNDPQSEPIRNLLPVVTDPAQVRSETGRGDFHDRYWALQATPQALDHAATRLSSQVDRNQDRWAEIAGTFWAFPAKKPKPAASALLLHPDPALAREGQPRPVVAVQYYEGGRVLWCGIDSTWRWRATAQEVYDRFWIQSLRYLTEGRLLGDRTLLLQTDSETSELGDLARISVYRVNEEFQPLQEPSIDALVTDPESRETVVTLLADPVAPGWFRGHFAPRSLGDHVITLAGATGPAASARASLSVVTPTVEFETPQLDQASLQAIASRTGGTYRPLEQLVELPDVVPDLRQTLVTTDEPIPLWDNALSMSVLALLLTVEWILRKANRLL